MRTSPLLAVATMCIPFAAPALGGEGGKVHPALHGRFAERTGPVKAWVFFTDKGSEAEASPERALAQVAAGYEPRAIERRQRRRTWPGLFDAHDLPVAAAHVRAIETTGATHHLSSRWLNAVSVFLQSEHVDALADLPFVRAIEPVRRGVRIDPRIAPLEQAGGAAGGFYGESEGQLALMNLLPLHASGATGTGVIIGVLDTGFHRVHTAFYHPTHPLVVLAEHDFINDDGNTDIEPGDYPNQYLHGTLILGALGAYQPGVVVGAAYDASFILCKTEDISDEYQGEEDNYVGGLELIESMGGDVATSSLGYIDWYTQDDLDGQTAVTTIAVNVATANGVFCCTAAGNGGHDADPGTSHLLAPADALQVIACGAVSGESSIAGFSSDGPSADGRVKPEVLAQGVDTVTINPNEGLGTVTASGTSLATPMVAGAVACIAQARPGWTVDQLRQLLLETAGDFVQNGVPDPLFVRGYGIVDAFAAVSADCDGNGAGDDDELAGGAPDSNDNGVLDVCDADFNGDLEVNVQDLVQLILEWGACGPLCPEDLNGDGEVDVQDLVFLILNWSD